MTPETVFVLFHVHELANGDEDEKLLGVYASRDQAVSRIEAVYRSLPGFCEEGGEFIVDEYRIGQDQWTEGFVSRARTSRRTCIPVNANPDPAGSIS